jgi:hypothetical protein
MAKFLSSETGAVVSPGDLSLRVRFRDYLSKSKRPMTLYTKLNATGELTTDACIMLLFNPNLQSYRDINTIALETCIPASYIIAKLLKTRNQPKDALATWIQKVPSVKSLWTFIAESESKNTGRYTLETSSDRKRSFQQCQMDFAAHMCFIMKTEGFDRALKVKIAWVSDPIDNLEISREKRLEVLKLAFLQLGKQQDRVDHLIALSDTKVSHLKSLALAVSMGGPLASRRKYISQIMEDFASVAGDSVNLARIVSVIKDNCLILGPKVVAEHSQQFVTTWLMSMSERDRVPSQHELKLANSFISWALENSRSAPLLHRGRLESLKSKLQDIGKIDEKLDSGFASIDTESGSI